MPFSSFSRYLPFSASTTTLQGVTYLLGISLFSISFLVFLNSSVSFVVTDLIGQKKNVGDVVGTLGFVDEIVALIACPVWGLISDRLGVRWVAMIGYAIISIALALFVQARNVYPQLILARIFFAVGASAAATMVTAILPSLTNEPDTSDSSQRITKATRNPRLSVAFSVESEATITPERYTQTQSANDASSGSPTTENARLGGDPSTLAGYVGLFTGCGALVALSLFLPLPTQFGEIDGVTPGEAVSYSFYVVGLVAFLVAIFVAFGLRNLKGEEGKGWRLLLGRKNRDANDGELDSEGIDNLGKEKLVPYLHLLQDSVILGLTDSRIALGYIGGFVARASTVAISLFIPLFVNTFFISRGFCQGSPNDPSPELKEECRTAYILSSILTGVAQLMGLLCAPLFGYLSSRTGRVNYPVIVGSVFGMVGYTILPQLSSPEIKNVDGRGGTPAIFLVVSLIGISQIAAIVCSLGSLGRGVLAVDMSHRARSEVTIAPGEDEAPEETQPLIRIPTERTQVSRVRLKGSIAGVYSLCGGAAILLLTKLGGYLFDKVSHGAPFYMMAIFNGILLVASLLMDASQAFARNQSV
ncbi:hypothetical protein S7711_07186 [Stachybotrys chartarum IBT 7711]|uniref:Major facilitator superfamily (MFS) profile domain-containing protein n=1 Tax=Stachybotrys chartarum (strain CBS 109288 / IBT 7711) TaxID=1280523 RepID=A0A084AKH5_STACB|nr:hypothetical protein S7711_07186 [Stachybotrys chartarum IBT 7711]KFA55764.1 hypothetical protein S40293_01917 [Stachybotrys chartarum IBT 40293]KFA79521.1 hypothetical protein S40288_01076 [Stachybotrys chartarum IBT 40288]